MQNIIYYYLTIMAAMKKIKFNADILHTLLFSRKKCIEIAIQIIMNNIESSLLL